MLGPSSTGTSRPRTTDRLGVRVRSPIYGSGMRHVTGRDYVNSICSVPRGCLHIYLLNYDLKCMNWRSSASMTQHRFASVLNSRSIRKLNATSAVLTQHDATILKNSLRTIFSALLVSSSIRWRLHRVKQRNGNRQFWGVLQSCTNVRLTWFQFFIWNQSKVFYKVSNISFPWRFFCPYCLQGEVD